jgi:hypothetical protein
VIKGKDEGPSRVLGRLFYYGSTSLHKYPALVHFFLNLGFPADLSLLRYFLTRYALIRYWVIYVSFFLHYLLIAVPLLSEQQRKAIPPVSSDTFNMRLDTTAIISHTMRNDQRGKDISESTRSISPSLLAQFVAGSETPM